MAFRHLFERRSSAPSTRPAPAQSPAPGTRIGYDPLLISQLQRGHRRLLDLFAITQSLLTSRDYAGVQRALGEFRILLQDHMLLANTKLYVYLSRQLAADPERSALINSVRREMLETGRNILDCLRTYSAVRLDDQGAVLFQDELLEIGTVLMQRMEREESNLFPLYKRAY